MLVYAGANVRATTRLGAYTPLMMAAQAGHADAVEALARRRRRREGDDGSTARRR